jgi:hypothetical protein
LEISRIIIVRVEYNRILCPIDIGVIFCKLGFSEYNIVFSKVSNIKDLFFGTAINIDINMSYISSLSARNNLRGLYNSGSSYYYFCTKNLYIKTSLIVPEFIIP